MKRRIVICECRDCGRTYATEKVAGTVAGNQFCFHQIRCDRCISIRFPNPNQPKNDDTELATA